MNEPVTRNFAALRARIRILPWALVLSIFPIIPPRAVASRTCTGGTELGDFKLTVEPAKGGPALPLTSMNVLQPGEKLHYIPVHAAADKNKKDKARIALVFVPAAGTSQAHVEVMDVKQAGRPAAWEVPFQVSVVGLVFGPDGLNVKKVNALVKQDPELIPQLADYADRSSKVEALVQALSKYEQSAPGSSTLQDVLNAFSSQYGVSLPKLSSSTAPDQQAAQLLHAVLPAFGSADPLGSHTSLAVQSTSLATSVATMFFGSPVALAAGGAILANDLRASLFPRTAFHSAFAHPAATDTMTLCSDVPKAKPHTRNAYLWMVRVPGLKPPSLSVTGTPHLPLGSSSILNISAATIAQLKQVPRARDWEMVSASSPQQKALVPVKVSIGSSGDRLTLDLSHVKLPPGEYYLIAKWDWSPLPVKGMVNLRSIPEFTGVKVTPDTQDRLLSASGNVQIALTGADFEFVRNVSLAKASDLQAVRTKAVFTLPKGFEAGEQNTLSVSINTTGLQPGGYMLRLEQVNGATHDVPVTVHPPNPDLTNLPLRVNLGEAEQTLELHGAHLERIQQVTSGSTVWKLAPVAPENRNLSARQASVTLGPSVKQGDLLSADLVVEGIRKPLTIPNVLRVAGPLPKISSVQKSFTADTGVRFRDGEIPADSAASFVIRAEHADARPTLHLACAKQSDTKRTLSLAPGEKNGAAELNALGAGVWFLSLAPGSVGRPGCLLTAAVAVPDSGTSVPYPLGRVTLLPRIDKFTLSSEKVGEALYAGTLRGQNLQLIDKTGWNTTTGSPVEAIPTPVPGNPQEQTLKIVMTWPPPSPQAPLYIWLRGENAGRATTAKY